MNDLNEGAVGKRYEGEVYEVTARAIAQYADAIGEVGQVYGGVAPPLFAVRPMVGVLFGAIEDPEVGIPLSRLVHGEQRMRFERVLRAGDVLKPRGELLSVEARSTGEVATLRQWLETRSGELVVEAVSALFVRSEAHLTRAATPSAASSAPRQTEAPPTQDVVERVRRVAADQSARYAVASGDHNPLHLDDAFAREAGLPGVILQGLCTMGMAASAVVEVACGGEVARLAELWGRFSRPVFMGDEVRTRVWEEAAVGAGAWGFEALNQRGERVLSRCGARVR